MKFLGITFDSQFTFKKHFEEILGHCNTRYHRIRLLTNRKWGRSPSTILQIYKQYIRPIFEYGSLSKTSDTIISKIQLLENKFIQLALCLPIYISVKQLHDSSGLPYVKDRLLSCATRTLERISKNPLVEESISSHRVNPEWDRFPTPLSMIHPVLTFQKHSEDILDHCNTRHHRLQLLANKKWGPRSSTIIYKQWIRLFFNTALFRPLPHWTISSAKFHCSKTSLFGLPFVYQNTYVLSYSMTPMAFHM